jgi:hypothetical protein
MWFRSQLAPHYVPVQTHAVALGRAAPGQGQMLEQRARQRACKPQLYPRCARLQARAFGECASTHGVRLVETRGSRTTPRP